MRTTLDDCADAAGSFNNPNIPGNGIPGTASSPSPSPSPYVPPELCIGEWSLTDESSKNSSLYQESLAAENLNVSGAAVNVFKLLGVHEQGRLVDLTGQGSAVSSSGSASLAFDSLAAAWISFSETGIDVVQRPSFIGYDFGPRMTSYGQPESVPETNNTLHVTSFRITQPSASNRALQVRVDRSNGGYKVNPLNVNFTGVGNGGVGSFNTGFAPRPGTFMIVSSTPTLFAVTFISSSGATPLGVATVGVRFNSPIGSFLISPGLIPFSAGDMFTMPIELDWHRVDVLNLPNIDTPVTVRVKQSSPSRFWRLVPLSFTGVMSPSAPWIVDKLELFDYQQTRLDDIQDSLYMENRDRDYSKTSIQIKAAVTPFDAASDLSKFGFSIADVWTFTTSFATMVKALGRPIVVGDVLEIPFEMQYDHNLRPVRKFVEVSDVSWAADGFTTNWDAILYRFQAQDLIPSQEHRDILGTVDTQKYIIDDGSFFAGVEQIQTAPLTVSEKNEQDAITAVPEKGTSTREQASGTNRFNQPGTYEGVGPYVEDGLPPDGLPYETGFGKLPDVSGAQDAAYFRLEYDPKLKIPARLYKFSGVKGKWIFVETDRRTERSAHRPSQLEILDRTETMSLTTKRIT